jgi:translocation and assembly module TamA
VLAPLLLPLEPVAGQEATEASAPAAADPAPAAEAPEDRVQPYATTITPTGDDDLDRALSTASQLVRLRERAPTTATGIVARARRDQEGLVAALRSEGYYDGRVSVTVDGSPLDTPGLAARIEGRQAPVPVTVTAEKGERYRIGRIELTAADPAGEQALAAIRPKLTPPAPDSPARAEPVIALGDAAVAALRAAGYPLAQVGGRDAVIDTATHRLDVRYAMVPGPAADFARPEVTGRTQVDPRLTATVAGQMTGKPYSPETLEKTRRSMLALGAFEAVRMRPGDRLDSDGRLPVTIDVADRPRRAIGFTAAYETRYGPSASVYWEHRNLFGGAERLRLSAEVSRLGLSSDTEDTNARLDATLRKPWLFGQDMTLILGAAGIRERLDAYDRDAVTGSVQVEKRLNERLTGTLGPFVEFSNVGPTEEEMRKFQLYGLNGSLRWDTTDSVFDPSKGWRITATAAPTWSAGDSIFFLRGRVVASTYWDITGDRGSILAVRGALGSILGAERAELPDDRRFYAGGGGSVRGYGYQRIGPRDARDKPIGGLSTLETSIELRQRVSGPIGMAVFLDGGAVSDEKLPGGETMRWGAGLGIRYATALGPLRADVAVPLNKQSGDSGFGIYIGLGQAF